MQWIRAIEEWEDVLWLYGSAGAGKSAIAQTIAEMCTELGLIVASLFFSRSDFLNRISACNFHSSDSILHRIRSPNGHPRYFGRSLETHRPAPGERLRRCH